MFRFSKKKPQINLSNDNDDIIKFYSMLLKYKRRHPTFNVNKVVYKLYQRQNLKSLISQNKQ